MRICIVYDCLFPFTVGGAERWYRNLAERLAAEGHEITYLTLRQWPVNEGTDLGDIRVVTVGPRMALYGRDGQRRIIPPLVFGIGVFAHLFLRGRYDVVHTASFPYFSVLAAAVVRPFRRYRLLVDWHELWSRRYWLGYLGPLLGWIGIGVQRICLAIPQEAFCFARLTADRLKQAGLNGPIIRLEGEYHGPTEPRAPRKADPLVLFAGRHIPEKRVTSVVDAIARARIAIPALRGLILGDGPERPAVLEAIARYGLNDVIVAPGFVTSEDVQDAMASALCLLHPSSREGYGLVVVEASSFGTPTVLVRGEDNAATELIEEGVNGTVAPSASAESLAEAIMDVNLRGHALRESTAAWFAANASRLVIASSLKHIVQIY